MSSINNNPIPVHVQPRNGQSRHRRSSHRVHTVVRRAITTPPGSPPPSLTPTRVRSLPQPITPPFSETPSNLERPVEGVGMNVSLPPQEVEGVGMSVNISPQPQNSRLRVAVQRVSPDVGMDSNLRVNVNRVGAPMPAPVPRPGPGHGPARPIVLSNQYSATHGRAITSVKQEEQAMMEDTYRALKEAILPPGCSQFVVSFSQEAVTYKDASGAKVVKKLQPILEENIILKHTYESARELLSHDIWKGDISASKRTQLASFVRSNDALQQLPQAGAPAYAFALNLLDATGANQAQKDEAVKRMAAAEKLMSLMAEKINDGITQTNESLRLNPEDVELKTKLRHLKEKGAQFNKLDRTAVYAAVAFFPQDDKTPENIEACAKALARALDGEVTKRNTEVKKGARLWLPDLPVIRMFRKDVNITENKNWAMDVSALLFAPIADPATRDHTYGSYCKNNSLYLKEETLENSMLRMVLNPQAIDREKEALFFDRRLHENVQDVLNDDTVLTETDQNKRIAQFRTAIGLA